jgi:hypothetical protein
LLRFMIVPPNAPSTRIATPPPSSASSELSLEEAGERSARSTAAGRGAAGRGVRGWVGTTRDASWRTPRGALSGLGLACPDPPEPGGLIPAPNSAVESAAWPGAAPVCLAWLIGSAYSFAAGDPGSACTPGSKPSAAWAETVKQLIAMATKAAAAEKPVARTSKDDSVSQGAIRYPDRPVDGLAANPCRVRSRGLSAWARS